jgi:hypothetical protein
MRVVFFSCPDFMTCPAYSINSKVRQKIGVCGQPMDRRNGSKSSARSRYLCRISWRTGKYRLCSVRVLFCAIPVSLTSTRLQKPFNANQSYFPEQLPRQKRRAMFGEGGRKAARRCLQPLVKPIFSNFAYASSSKSYAR